MLPFFALQKHSKKVWMPGELYKRWHVNNSTATKWSDLSNVGLWSLDWRMTWLPPSGSPLRTPCQEEGSTASVTGEITEVCAFMFMVGRGGVVNSYSTMSPVSHKKTVFLFLSRLTNFHNSSVSRPPEGQDPCIVFRLQSIIFPRPSVLKPFNCLP